MTVRKVILYSLILPAGLSLFIIYKAWGDEPFLLFFFCFFVFGAWGIGTLLGLFLSAIVKKPTAEPYFYLSGQIVVALVITGFVLSQRYANKQHEEAYGNIEGNRSLVGLRHNDVGFWTDSSDGMGPVRTAYFKLESMFPDSNSLCLTTYTCRNRDTLINGRPDTVYIVYFAYTVHKKEFLSQIRVVGSDAVINYLDAEPGSEPYNKLNGEANRVQQRVLRASRDAVDSLPDSLRRTIRQAMPELNKK